MTGALQTTPHDELIKPLRRFDTLFSQMLLPDPAANIDCSDIADTLEGAIDFFLFKAGFMVEYISQKVQYPDKLSYPELLQKASEQKSIGEAKCKSAKSIAIELKAFYLANHCLLTIEEREFLAWVEEKTKVMESFLDNCPEGAYDQETIRVKLKILTKSIAWAKEYRGTYVLLNLRLGKFPGETWEDDGKMET